MNATYLARIETRLRELEAGALRRRVRERTHAGIDFSSNDYLGLTTHPDVVGALRRATAAGSGGSRLLAGAHPALAALERDLAAWVARDAALVFSSGYLAMLGAIGALAPHFRAAYSDEYNHACIIDALRLTKLRRRVYPHLALPAAAERESPALIVTESAFGMSGTQAPLKRCIAALGDGDAAVIDEAHALGVAGPRGAGAATQYGDARVIVVGTLSKALGGLGGFVAGPAAAIELLASDARSFVFDTALPPVLAEAMRISLGLVAGAEGDRRRSQLAQNVARLRAGLAAREIAAPGEGPIVPLPAGEPSAALALSQTLRECGINAPAIRPPTVPRGGSLVRVTVRADHTPSDIDALLNALPRTPAGVP